jgi:hypothetical protein
MHGSINIKHIKWSLVLLLGFLPAQIWGQAVGAISGTVTDSTGVDSIFYNTVSMLHTIEDMLGTPHLNLNAE